MAANLTKADIRAIKASIGKWRRVATGEGDERGVRNCALCKLHFLRADPLRSCRKCPVYQRTDLQFCGGSPFEDWVALHDTRNLRENAGGDGYFAVTKKAKEIAQREVEFLTSLLPDGMRE